MHHSTLSMAKRYCSMTANCFGIDDDIDGGGKYSIEFPIALWPGGNYIHKKENIFGNFYFSRMILCKKKIQSLIKFNNIH